MSAIEVASLFGTLELRDTATQALQTFNSGIDQTAQKLTSIGQQTTQFGTSLTTLTAPILAFLGTSLKAVSDLDDEESQLNAVLKSTGGVAGVTADQVNKLASSYANTTRFSKEAVLSGEDMLLTFTSIGKDVFPDATKTALDMSQALGQDLKSSSIELGKALNDPITGITALRRVGVQFTQSQEDQIKALVKSGNLEQAQVLILKELQREFGGSAEAAGTTFAGKMDILNHKFQDFQVKVGTMLMPTIEKVTDVIGNVIDKVSAWADANPQLFSTILQILGALAVAGPLLIVVGTAISSIGSIVGTVGAVLGSSLLLPIAAIVGAVAGLYLAWTNNWLGIRDFVQPILDVLKNDFNFFTQALGEQGLLGAVKRMFTTFEDGSSQISGLLETLGVAPQIAEAIGQTINNLVDPIIDGIKRIVDGLQANLPLVPFYFSYYFNKIWSVVGPALQPIIDWFGGTGSNSFSGAVQTAWTFINTNFIQPLVWMWTKVLEPQFAPILNWFIGTGDNSFIGAVAKAYAFINNNFIQPLSTFWNDTLKPGFDQLVTFFTGLWNNVLKPALQPILDFLGTLSTDINNLINQFSNLTPAGRVAQDQQQVGQSGGSPVTLPPSTGGAILPIGPISSPGSGSPLPPVTGTAGNIQGPHQGFAASVGSHTVNGGVHIHLPNVTSIDDPAQLDALVESVAIALANA